jgi:hypothetical protein
MSCHKLSLVIINYYELYVVHELSQLMTSYDKLYVVHVIINYHKSS